MIKISYIKKRELLLELINQLELDAILITRQNNFSWLTGGNNYVEISSIIGECKILITKSKDFLISNNIEAPRIINEELYDSDLQLEVKIFNWFEPDKEGEIINRIVGSSKIGSDIFNEQYPYIGNDINKLRYVLNDKEIEKYKTLGLESGLSVESVCHRVKRGDTELEIAAKVGMEFFQRKIIPVVLNVAVDDRIEKYRHPIPGTKKLENHVMIAACGRRDGLITSLTREVYFGKLNPDLQARHRTVMEIDGYYIYNTRPGSKVSDIFRKAILLYENKGYADEWQQHHQGGPIGYSTREYLVSNNQNDIVNVNQAFAWNPTIMGTKSEDTVLILKEDNMIITNTGDFPYYQLEYDKTKIRRPDILVKDKFH